MDGIRKEGFRPHVGRPLRDRVVDPHDGRGLRAEVVVLHREGQRVAPLDRGAVRGHADGDGGAHADQGLGLRRDGFHGVAGAVQVDQRGGVGQHLAAFQVRVDGEADRHFEGPRGDLLEDPSHRLRADGGGGRVARGERHARGEGVVEPGQGGHVGAVVGQGDRVGEGVPRVDGLAAHGLREDHGGGGGRRGDPGAGARQGGPARARVVQVDGGGQRCAFEAAGLQPGDYLERVVPGGDGRELPRRGARLRGPDFRRGVRGEGQGRGQGDAHPDLLRGIAPDVVE